MDFDTSKMMVGILYQVHTQMTRTNPITYHEFPIPKISFSIFTPELLDTTTEICFEKYKNTKEGELYSSVDVNPSFWTDVYVNTMYKAQVEKNKIGKIPNGCCTIETCGIRKYYEIIHDYCMNITE